MVLALLGLLGDGFRCRGALQWKGQPRLSAGPQRPNLGCQITAVFQDPVASFNPVRTLGSQIREALSRHGQPWDQRALLAPLADFDLEPTVLEHYPWQLSVGQCQRAMLCLATRLAPAVLLADEPTSALDPIGEVSVLAALGRVRQRGAAVVLLSHDLAMLQHYCDRTLKLTAGRLVAADVAIEINTQAPRVAVITNSTPILKVRNLSAELNTNGRRFLARPRPFLRNIDFDLHASETLAIVGRSGCGKTTLARVLLGLHARCGGVVKLGSDRLDGARRRHRARAMQMVFQNPATSLNPRMTVGQLVGEPLRQRLAGRSKEMASETATWLTKVGLSAAYANRYPSSLSGGQQQRVAIARALAAAPRVLIADEPVTSLDTAARAAIMRLLHDLKNDLGLAIILITHDLASASMWADRMLVMDQGQIVEQGQAASIMRQPQTNMTRDLVAAAQKKAAP